MLKIFLKRKSPSTKERFPINFFAKQMINFQNFGVTKIYNKNFTYFKQMLVLKVVLPSASLVLHGGFTSKWGVEKTKITKKRPWWPHLENAYSAKTIRCYSHLASLLSRDFKLWKNLKTVLRVFLKCFLLLSALKCVGMRNRRTSWEQKTAFLGKLNTHFVHNSSIVELLLIVPLTVCSSPRKQGKIINSFSKMW